MFIALLFTIAKLWKPRCPKPGLVLWLRQGGIWKGPNFKEIWQTKEYQETDGMEAGWI
jgi:hypothetical protein